MKSWLIQSPKGDLKGPASTREVARAVHAGVVRPDQLVTPAEGGGGWQRIDAVPELKRELDVLADEDQPTMAIANPADDPLLKELLARSAVPSQPPPDDDVIQTALMASSELAALEATMVAPGPRKPMAGAADAEATARDIGGMVRDVLDHAPVVSPPPAGFEGDDSATRVAPSASRVPVPPISDRLPPSVPSHPPVSAASGVIAANMAPMPVATFRSNKVLFAFALGLAGGLAALMVAYALFADL